MTLPLAFRQIHLRLRSNDIFQDCRGIRYREIRYRAIRYRETI